LIVRTGFISLIGFY